MSSEVARIVIVDDHPIFGLALLGLLESTLGRVDVSLVPLADAADLQNADLALVDVHLKNRSGITLIAEACRHDPAPIFVAISGDDRYDTQHDAFLAGATAFISKSADPDKITEVLGFLIGRRPFVPRLLGSGIALGQPAVPQETKRLELSAREKQIVMLIGQGLGNEAIAERVNISVNTVKQHIARLLAAHGVDNRTQLLKALAKPN